MQGAEKKNNLPAFSLIDSWVEYLGERLERGSYM